MKKTQLAANVIKADLDQRIVVGFEPPVGLPMDTFGFAAVAIQDASLPTQASAKIIGSGGCPVASAYFLCGVAQPATLEAGELPALCVKHRHTLAAP